MEQHCPEHSAHGRAIREHDTQLDAHGEQLDKLNETLAALKEIERQNQERIDSMGERIAALESVPASPLAKWPRTTYWPLCRLGRRHDGRKHRTRLGGAYGN